MLPRTVRLCLVAGAMLLVGATATGSATQVIDTLHAAMLDVMRESARLSYQERFSRLAPAIDRAFDLDFMARKALGQDFDKLDPAKQQRWLQTFRNFMVANYAGRFHGYAGQRFESLDEEPSAQGTTLVRTRLIDSTADNIDLTYRLRKAEAGWRIIDVYLKGTVSELALRRSDFSSLLAREGFDALVASVDRKVAELASGKVK